MLAQRICSSSQSRTHGGMLSPEMNRIVGLGRGASASNSVDNSCVKTRIRSVLCSRVMFAPLVLRPFANLGKWSSQRGVVQLKTTFMSAPLPESVTAALKDPTSALAALLVIASAHREIFTWATQVIRLEAPSSQSPSSPRDRPPHRRAKARKPKANGGRKPADPYHERRRAQRDGADENLLEAMRASPGATINDLAAAIGKSRTSTVTGLHRLRDAGLVTNAGRNWALALVEQDAPHEPVEKWVAPLSAKGRAHAVAHA
jgi:hypothetical protein